MRKSVISVLTIMCAAAIMPASVSALTIDNEPRFKTSHELSGETFEKLCRSNKLKFHLRELKHLNWRTLEVAWPRMLEVRNGRLMISDYTITPRRVEYEFSTNSTVLRETAQATLEWFYCPAFYERVKNDDGTVSETKNDIPVRVKLGPVSYSKRYDDESLKEMLQEAFLAPDELRPLTISGELRVEGTWRNVPRDERTLRNISNITLTIRPYVINGVEVEKRRRPSANTSLPDLYHEAEEKEEE